jgi:aminoacyl-tRNA hydrolase/ribosomal protein bL25 (Ctc-form)
MEATLEAVKRSTAGKNAKNEARRLRAAGSVPAVVYGASTGDAAASLPVSVDPKSLLRILHSDSGVNTLIKLRVDGTETSVLVKEYQLDPITNRLLHADFYQLAMDKLLTLTVPVVLKGEPRGVKLQGGLLDFVTRDIEVECLPANIPEHIDIDVSGLELHQSIRVRDLPANDKWKAVSDGETMLVHIVMPKAEESAAAATPDCGGAGGGARGGEEGQDRQGRGEGRQGQEIEVSGFWFWGNQSPEPGAWSPSSMKLVVGLGNPGRDYRKTRHNAGFMVVDEVARRHQLTWAPGPAQVAESFVVKQFGETPVLLAKPLTYMNRSGDVVAGLARYFDVPVSDLLVVVDEAALPFGRLRVRRGGSAGGHNGLKSIIAHLGTDQFPRLRVGVGRGDARRDLADHVLGRFEGGESAELEEVITRAADAVEMFAAADIEQVMNTYNPEAAAPEHG